MPSIINSNQTSLNARHRAEATQGDRSRTLARLASGMRINGASDDAAGLAISERFTAQIRGDSQAARNANDGISLAQTAEGALASVGDNLQRIRELAVQSANATNSASDRASLQLDVAQLVAEIDRVARQTSFNGTSLLDGSFVGVGLQVGANPGQTVAIDGLSGVRTRTLGVRSAPAAAPTTTAVSGATLTASSTITGAGQLVINGVDVYQGAAVFADAKSIAGAINAAHIPGVSATAPPNVAAGTWSASGSTYQVIVVNGSSFDVPVPGNKAGDIAATIARFAAFGPPDVVATSNGAGVTLTTADGSNLDIGFNGFSGPIRPEALGLGGIAHGVTSGLNTATTYGRFDLSYSGLGALSIGGSRASLVGLPTIAPASSTTGTPLDRIDVSSAAGAIEALDSVDAAIETAVGQRAMLGALQSRLASVVASCMSAVGTASAARSRVRDTDFAAETARLARSQILQQASVAMIAQANQQPQQVMQLLR